MTRIRRAAAVLLVLAAAVALLVGARTVLASTPNEGIVPPVEISTTPFNLGGHMMSGTHHSHMGALDAVSEMMGHMGGMGGMRGGMGGHMRDMRDHMKKMPKECRDRMDDPEMMQHMMSMMHGDEPMDPAECRAFMADQGMSEEAQAQCIAEMAKMHETPRP